MRALRMLVDASVCQNADALRDPAVVTYGQLQAYDHRNCPLFGRCNSGTLLGPNLRNCVPWMAQNVARYAARPGGSVEAEMAEFRAAPVFSRLGFIDPYVDPNPDATIADRSEICVRVEAWVNVILGGKPDSLQAQIGNAHCSDHDAFTEGCAACGIARLVVTDATEVVSPSGASRRVLRRQCRCPIVEVGDFCPVHGG